MLHQDISYNTFERWICSYQQEEHLARFFICQMQAGQPPPSIERDMIAYFIFTAVHKEVCPSFISHMAGERMDLLLAGQSRGSGCARGSKHGTQYRQAARAGRVGPSGRG